MDNAALLQGRTAGTHDDSSGRDRLLQRQVSLIPQFHHLEGHVLGGGGFNLVFGILGWQVLIGTFSLSDAATDRVRVKVKAKPDGLCVSAPGETVAETCWLSLGIFLLLSHVCRVVLY